MPSATRRAIVLGGLGLAATPLISRAQSAEVDVAIVGAGAAGLACARECARLGASFILLEARPRIGGRVFTDESLGAPLDAGAVYIHWSERNPWAGIAAERSVATVDSESLPNHSRFFADDRPADRSRRRAGFAGLDDLFDLAVGPVPDVSLIDRVGEDPDMRRGANAIGRMAIGDEPERISALDYARLWSGTDLLVPSGYGKLVAAYGAGLAVRLSTLVTRIDWRGAGVALDTPAGRLTARTAVITVPVGVLTAERIAFDPPLPRETLAGLEGLAMGSLTKIGLQFDGERFGVATGTDLWDQIGPRSGFDFECWPFDRNIVVVYFGGDHARALCKLGEAAAVAEVVERFGRLVGADAKAHLVGAKLYDWTNAPFSLGAYSHALPGHADARAALARPVGGRLCFAGEAVGAESPAESFGGAMTAGGAFLSGRAAAGRAVAAARGG